MCSYELHPLIVSVPERNSVDKVVTGMRGPMPYFTPSFTPNEWNGGDK